MPPPSPGVLTAGSPTRPPSGGAVLPCGCHTARPIRPAERARIAQMLNGNDLGIHRTHVELLEPVLPGHRYVIDVDQRSALQLERARLDGPAGHVGQRN